MDDEALWTVPVKDPHGRARTLAVRVTDDHEVSVTTPPGDGFILPTESHPILRDALNSAASVAAHRRRWAR